ncbi:MAG: gliding motility-associated C-terminal domain-containing protein [Bacteroidota bacterium]
MIRYFIKNFFLFTVLASALCNGGGFATAQTGFINEHHHQINDSDTLTIMFYNLLNFPNGGTTPNREDTLKKILHYVKPDILIVCELQNEQGADTILNYALNQNGIDHYVRANFVSNQSSGNQLQNMIFYNSNKVVLSSQAEIITDLRDWNEYIVYGNDPNLSNHNDTAFIDFYVSHLKSSSSSSDQNRRELECDSLRTYVDTKPPGRNMILGADLNIYTDAEAAYQTLTTGAGYKFNDPISSPGSWNDNPAFTSIHTQCTRLVQVGSDGASAGMDDRFDQILVSDSVLTGGNRVKYLSGSYYALGNDGNHLNVAIIDTPANNSAPDSIINALYYFSDHLPVIMKMTITYPPSLCSAIISETTMVTCFGDSAGSATVSATGGTAPFSYLWNDPNSQTDSIATGLLAGTYNVSVTDSNGCIVNNPVTITEPLDISLVLNSTDENCPGKGDGAIDLTVTGGISPYTNYWLPGGEITEDISGLQEGVYIVIITDAINCLASDTVLISTLQAECPDSLNIPSSFTPNNDGTNDTWIIRGIELYPEIVVEIYNRWGSLMFSSKGYGEPWDGIYYGEPVPSATYYYIIILDEDQEPITGTVTVVR